MTESRHSAVSVLLKIAVDFDQQQKYSEALVCYTEGIQLLLNLIKESANDSDKVKLRTKIKDYMNRAEELKNYATRKLTRPDIPTPTMLGHKEIIVENNSTGHSYQSLFGQYMDNEVSEVVLEDAYIKVFHQFQNFLRFCELAVKLCANLRKIRLITTKGDADQDTWLSRLKCDLQDRYRVQLDIEYSFKLHDRAIRLNNGWVIKIGRGLDYFKNAPDKFSIGYQDMDLRLCHETRVDIFHENVSKKSYA